MEEKLNMDGKISFGDFEEFSIGVDIQNETILKKHGKSRDAVVKLTEGKSEKGIGGIIL